VKEEALVEVIPEPEPIRNPDNEVVLAIQKQTKDTAERYNVIFRCTSTALNHLLETWGVSLPEKTNIVAVMKKQAALESGINPDDPTEPEFNNLEALKKHVLKLDREKKDKREK
jgi:hypothetical protein